MNLPFDASSIKFKILGTTSLLLLLLIISSFFSIYTLNSIGGELENIAERDIPLTEKLTLVTLKQLEQATAFERAARYAGLTADGDHAAELFRESMKLFEDDSKAIVEELHQAETFAKTAIAQARTPEEVKEFEHVVHVVKQIEEKRKKYESHVHEAFAALEKNDLHASEALSEKIEHEQTQISHDLEALQHEVEKFTATAAKTAEEHEHSAINIMFGIAVVSILFGIGLSLFIAGIISRGMNKAVDCAETIASGDFSQRLEDTGGGEIGQLLNAMETMRTKLVGMFTSISGAATQLASSAEELSAITTQTTTGIKTQHMETDQVATAMNEMAATVDEVARNAGTAAEGAQEADKAAKAGQRIVDDTITVMGQVASNVEANAGVVRKLNDDSDKIGVVLDVIRGIAEQTNLLALNAAIEAARAGEQGRGFAVVADEVRTLASRTQESTQEIQEVIEGLQANAKEAVIAMDAGATQAHAGVEKASEAGAALATIASSVASITDMNHQIASASEEQSAVAKEIDKSVINISQVATETATGADQLAAASHELAQLSTGLQGMVAEYKIS